MNLATLKGEAKKVGLIGFSDLAFVLVDLKFELALERKREREGRY